MVHLLGLPRELRDEIIHHVLYTPLSMPLSLERKVCHDPYESPFANRIHYLASKSAYQPTALGLLLASRQLHVETCQALEKNGTIFTLDLAIVNECWLWPTWRLIPTRIHPCLERMDINLRLCCTPGNEDLMTGFSARHDWHLDRNPIFQALCGLLRRFLSLGAIADTASMMEDDIASMMQNDILFKDCDFKRNFRIKCLRFNIDTTSSRNGQFSHEQVPGRIVNGMRHLTNDPLRSVDSTTFHDFQRCLRSMIEFNAWDRQAATWFLERIGTIVFNLDGIKIDEFNLAPFVEGDVSIKSFRRYLGLDE
ncbi:hypothetical protein K505DRAFT_372616 [Melanomma pulvis-pyrius CBS 109.77]|uniref:F-box domain-containing protein n=1 Tax=Melanomma pulvis-pyrius CBS 109.77 TaxID=1314802 RepID=A0A6A6XL11_9PLEO|nr:hypothetical protein K505DRAFT_372616 [Melanomma pulvis-pyrius CBS 109.77]